MSCPVGRKDGNAQHSEKMRNGCFSATNISGDGNFQHVGREKVLLIANSQQDTTTQNSLSGR
jgi:hypothetical protein